jgi:hypothetical protein
LGIGNEDDKKDEIDEVEKVESWIKNRPLR